MSALILGDPWECIPAHGAAVPSEPPALCSSHPAQVRLCLERQDFPLSCGILLCVEWKSFFLLQNEYIKTKVYLNVGHCDLVSFVTNQDGTEPSFLMNACFLLHLS